MGDDYRDYITSDAWARKRVEALRRTSGGRSGAPHCEVCGRRGSPFKNRVKDRRLRHPNSNGLEVHHLHYRNLEDELPEDLIVLCTDVLWLSTPGRLGCHEQVHLDFSFRQEVARVAANRW